MNRFNIKIIARIIESKQIDIVGLILHGSRILDIQNKESDIDILAVVESGPYEDIVEIINGEKYHILFINKHN